MTARPTRVGAGLVLLISLALAACSAQKGPYKAQLYVFGTLVEITLRDVTAAKGREAIARIREEFQRMHREWHAWEPGPLVDLNRAIAEGRDAEVPASIIPLIARSKTLYERSDGLFNPAIGGLLDLWGFQANEPPDGPLPPREEIEAWVAKDPGMDDLTLRDGVLHSDNPAVQLDFGAFAKGYAVDIAIEHLREMGVENAIVNAGGDLRAIGSKGGEPWRIGVRHPQGDGVLAAIEVSGDEAVFTSGNYERFREHEGVHYMHILDPRTGMPVKDVTSVTVIHDNGAEADAAATALVVAGEKDWNRIARKMGIRLVMLVVDDGTVYMNPAMRERVEFSGEAPPVEFGEPLR
ncbi:MAG TPA: FAD:protein FMN transferase [Gammaproteobacteria bacterium]|nr:FAD:protein FMN transferase [Gammaproteobacteria bacterium]